MRTHISLHTADIDESVRFYTTLLGIAPAKHFTDYALFVARDPELELALNRARSVAPANGTHYGIVVESRQEVDGAIERFRAAGLDVDIEIEETCCYAKQNKVWVRDPDGRRWETYVVLEEVAPEHAEGCCATA